MLALGCEGPCAVPTNEECSEEAPQESQEILDSKFECCTKKDAVVNASDIAEVVIPANIQPNCRSWHSKHCSIQPMGQLILVCSAPSHSRRRLSGVVKSARSQRTGIARFDAVKVCYISRSTFFSAG